MTDGETNASLRVADTVEAVTVTLDRALELLQVRREKLATQGGTNQRGEKT